jgi:hypothetical protein
MANWNRMLSPVREEPQNLFSLKFIGPSKRWNFREPYRIRRVQSFGEKWAFRRIMSAPRREGVRSSNEKSLPLLGSIAHKLRGEYAASAKVAEGEELGSNLLHVGQRTPVGSGGRGSWQRRGQRRLNERIAAGLHLGAGTINLSIRVRQPAAA